MYFTNPNNAKGAAPNIHNQDNVSIPKKFLKIKYNRIATTTAKDEKMNCLIDSPKNIDSLKSLISLLIFISITIPLFQYFSLYNPIISLTTLSEAFIVPTNTSILNANSPIYIHT